MKFLKYFLTLLCISMIGYAIHNDGESGPVCDAESPCVGPDSGSSHCQCWCSSCDGYRDKKNGADQPVYVNGKCYCNRRDVR